MASKLFRSNRPGARNAALIVLFAAVLFGGASRLDVLAPIVARLVAIIALGWLLWSTPRRALALPWTQALLIAGLIALPLAQLVPLPWPIWSELAGRDHARQVFELLGATPWQPLSLTPSRTLNALLALLPALAAFLIGARLDADARATVFAMVGVLAAVSGVLGIMQFVAGPQSSLYLYAITNRDSSVGFFSNANHHALFLCCGIAGTLMWLGGVMRDRRKLPPGQSLIAGVAIAIMLVSIAATSSRAGVGLAVVALIGGALLLPFERAGVRRPLKLALIGLPALALLSLVALAFSGVLGKRFMIEQGPNERIDYLPLFARIIGDHLPFGSGLGSFDPVFRSYEVVEDLYFDYLNNAHNDYAQIAIEAGLPGLILLAGFLIWFAFAAVAAWLRPHESERVARQQRAGTIVIIMLLAHSAVDYPLRTAALSVIFAFACAFLTAPSGARPRSPASRSAALSNDAG